MNKIEHIGVIGGGAWGTALAQSALKAGRQVLLWAYEEETVENINKIHENRDFLPGVTLDAGLHATHQLADFAQCDAVLLVIPAQFVRSITERLRDHLAAGTAIVICAKGIEKKSQKMMSEVVSETCPSSPLAVLSGPSFAAEVARGLPTAVTLASDHEILGRALALSLAHTAFRPYWSQDLIGAQIGGAVKNVLAIATGIVDGKGFGESAKAALITRGFAELMRFGVALGGRTETLSGLSGLGDLVLTCSSSRSRNMSLGCALGEGRLLDEILAERKSVTEGVHTASALAHIAREKNIDMPICQAVHNIVSAQMTTDEAIEALLSRPLKAEN